MKVIIDKVKNDDNKHRIFIDGSLIGLAYKYTDELEFTIDVENKSNIFSYSLDEFDDSLSRLIIPFSLKRVKDFEFVKRKGLMYVFLKDSYSIRNKFRWNDKAPYIFIGINFEKNKWEIPFSVMKMMEKLEKLCSSEDNIKFSIEGGESVHGFGLEYKIIDSNVTIEEIYKNILQKLEELLSAAVSGLLLETKQNSLTTLFHFPEEIQVACEQYLIYFSKFLGDLGIKAKSNIETEVRNTLFTIKPADSSQALSQIRDALNLYISLPEIPEVEIISNEYDDIAVQQLVSNIFHLKSQLLLSNSIIQTKEATIQSLSLTNFQQKQLLETHYSKVKAEEEVLDGLLTISEYKGKGFKINLAEIFRRLKRKLE